MKIYVKDDSNVKTLDGSIDLDKFNIQIDVSSLSSKPQYVPSIEVLTTDNKKYTLINCSLSAYGSNRNYIYEYNAYIDGWYDLDKLKINSIYAEYNEIQYLARKKE